LASDAVHALECIRDTAIIALADRKPISVRSLSDEFPIFAIDNVLTGEECEKIIDIARPDLRPSTQIKEGKSTVDEVRTSHTAYLDMTKHRVLRRAAKRLASLAGSTLEHVEKINVVRYRYGESYMFHHDFLSPGCKQFLEAEGQRVLTFFVYLNDVEQGAGGETFFPATGTKVTPIQGSAVFWPNTSENGSKRFYCTKHAGLPITKRGAVKYGMNVWITVPVATDSEDEDDGDGEDYDDGADYYDNNAHRNGGGGGSGGGGVLARGAHMYYPHRVTVATTTTTTETTPSSPLSGSALTPSRNPNRYVNTVRSTVPQTALKCTCERSRR
jgi:prolyl 4-hydroxylase